MLCMAFYYFSIDVRENQHHKVSDLDQSKCQNGYKYIDVLCSFYPMLYVIHIIFNIYCYMIYMDKKSISCIMIHQTFFGVPAPNFFTP